MPSFIAVTKKFPYTFPIVFDAIDGAVVICDYEPVLPIEYLHLIPYYFGGTTHPPTYISPPESWQNPSTWLMPEYDSECLWGNPHNQPYIFLQISTPTFLPDGTGATSPTSTSPSPGIGSGRSKTEQV